MEFKKMVTITLYAKQKKRHRCTEQTFRLCGRRRGWDVLREQHWNKYTAKGETDHQPRLDAWDSAQGWCTGKTQRDGMGREAGGGIGMGNTCKSMADSCQCMAKTTTKKKKLMLKHVFFLPDHFFSFCEFQIFHLFFFCTVSVFLNF